jgi:superfamily II DNA/RNA helicase
VLEPTRDLALQTLGELQRFAAHLPAPGLRQVALVGGQAPREYDGALAEGVDIVVGTVGKLAGPYPRAFSAAKVANLEAQRERERENYLMAVVHAYARFALSSHARMLMCSPVHERAHGWVVRTELVGRGELDVTEVRFFILDEADALVAQGLGRQITEMHRRIPKQTARKPRLQVHREREREREREKQMGP